MRYRALVPIVCAVALAVSCRETGPEQPPGSGRLVVYVYWDDQGLPGKDMELVELHASGKTDESGLAEFDAPAGDYTLRVYGINHGGPTLLFIDTPVTITTGQDTRIDIFDCLPCV